jgi:hypothetical protein
VDSSPCQVKPKTIKLVVVASWLSTQHSGERAKAGWLRIMIMSSIGKLKKFLILVKLARCRVQRNPLQFSSGQYILL